MTDIDNEARAMAREALQKIETHEKVCAVRWQGLQESMSELKTAVRQQTAHMWAAQIGVISVLIGAVAWLATRIIS